MSPRPNVGMGPEIKTDFPQVRRKSRREIKARFVSSEAPRAMSLVPTCTTSRVMEDGRDCSSPGSFSRISRTVAPGRQQVVALKKRIFRVIESPMIRVVGGKSGRG